MNAMKILFKIVFLLSSAIFFIFIAEGILRLLPKEMNSRISDMNVNQAGAIQYDQVLGWKIRPNIQVVNANEDYVATESFNSRGLRGPEYPYVKRNNEYRILILGDSFAENWTVNFNELFSEELKRRLSKRIDAYVEVINAGVRGYSTDQELLYFQGEGKEYHPDLTIVLFCDNDIWYNSEPMFFGRSKPLFTFTGTGPGLLQPPIESGYNVSISRSFSDEEKSLFRALKRYLRSNSLAHRFIARRINNSFLLRNILLRCGLISEGPLRLSESAFNGVVSYPAWYKIYECPNDVRVIKSWNDTEALLRKIRDEAFSVKSKTLVVSVPSRFMIYEKEWKRYRKKYGFKASIEDVRKTNIKLRAICKRNDILFINTTDPFIFKACLLEQKKETLFCMGSDDHLNRNGNRFLGAIIANFVGSNIAVQ